MVTIAWLAAVLAAGCAAGSAVSPAPVPPLARGLWVWSSATLLDDGARQQALFGFARERGIGALWFQVTTERAATGPLRLRVSRAPAWRQMIAAAHASGFAVEALDGDPIYADRTFHEVPLAIAEAVLAFNRDAPPAERFDGLHFDNEPYLLPGWADRATRERLLVDYLTLNDAIRRRVASQPPMTFGVDVPFWWTSRDDDTGEAVAAVTYGGVRQSATIHSLERLDAVTIMDYRNTADGPDGIIALAAPALDAAQRVGRARVRVGVETTRFDPAQVWFALGPPRALAAGTLGQSWRRTYPGEPFPLRTFDDGRRMHLGVRIDEGAAGAPAPAVLVELARVHGARTEAVHDDLAAALRAFQGNAEWRDARLAPIVEPSTGAAYAGITATYVPLPKITFATRPAEMGRELAAAERAFRRYARYGGLAIHDYDAYRALGDAARP